MWLTEERCATWPALAMNSKAVPLYFHQFCQSWESHPSHNLIHYRNTAPKVQISCPATQTSAASSVAHFHTCQLKAWTHVKLKTTTAAVAQFCYTASMLGMLTGYAKNVVRTQQVNMFIIYGLWQTLIHSYNLHGMSVSSPSEQTSTLLAVMQSVDS